ncbi:MAG: hypothetical protein HC902_04140 [Calothrix sp. SM1_5_4]|nr:hypothetical protein [Calothrix sp. SM1_5_4]
MPFKILVVSRGRDTDIVFEGAINEESQLPGFSEVPGKIFVDLAGVTMINSLGCRKWGHWLKESVKAGEGIHLIRCSPIMVHQINILAGFLPEGARVESFQVPYHCEACDFEERALFSRGRDFGIQESIDVQEQKPCPKCGGDMTLDVVADHYFKFLKRRAA